MTTLRVYCVPSGQWAGIILVDGEEIGRVVGCGSVDEVEEVAQDAGFEIENIETV